MNGLGWQGGMRFGTSVALLVALGLLGLGAAPVGARGGEQPLTQGGSGGANLTGLWQDDTGGGAVYRLRQVGDRVYWSVDGTSQGSYANVFVGTVEGDRIRGNWVDLPGSPGLGGGSLTLRIASNNQLVKVDESPCCYGATQLTRQGSAGTGPGTGTGGTGTGTGGTGTGTGTGTGSAGPATRADWSTTAQDRRGSSGFFTYTCPPNGSRASVWGTDVYTDDSSICTAAVHAGAITFARGGNVTIEIAGGQPSYTGSTRNGITTSNWSAYPGSFRVIFVDIQR
jgi:hypothetical protein